MNSFVERPKNESSDVTASEIAAFTYCATAWHLEYVQKASPTVAARVSRAEGVRRHERHGQLLEMQDCLERRRVPVTAALLLVGLVAILGILLSS